MCESPEVSQNVRDMIDGDLVLGRAKLLEIMLKVEREVRRGLKKRTHSSSEIKSFVTYVQELPDGRECGKFLALDLGGTNFRVLCIHLKGCEDYECDSKIYAIPQSLMLGSGEELFDHIAKCLAEFVAEHNLAEAVLPLGFTFSFPCKQDGLTKGLLIKWTKGFNSAGVNGKNVVELLQAAIKKRNDIKILVCAILNDTTGTLMSCAWKYRNCKIGVILGTGSNACYVEKVQNVELMQLNPGQPVDDYVIINTEWGAFGDYGSLEFIRTAFDREVDIHSINPGSQLFEKMISGMYVGELVRHVLVKLTTAGLLFNGKLSEKLQTRNQFFTKFLSEIESQPEGKFTETREILAELDIRNPSDQDCVNVRYVCECISRRAAHLVSAALSTLILKMGELDIAIGVDGSLYRFHPKIHDLMTEKIKELIPGRFKFHFVLSEDGSGRGAALVAAVASREVQNNSCP